MSDMNTYLRKITNKLSSIGVVLVRFPLMITSFPDFLLRRELTRISLVPDNESLHVPISRIEITNSPFLSVKI